MSFLTAYRRHLRLPSPLRRGFYAKVLAIALPISVQSLIQTSLNMIDELMVGQLGTTAIASVGIGMRPSFIYTFLMMGLAGGGGIFVAQFWGKGQRERLPAVVGSILAMGAPLMLLTVLISLLLPEQLMGLFTSDAQVVAQGAAYQRYLAPGFFFILFSSVYANLLRSTGHARLVMVFSLLKVVANTGLNYLLIFGHGGFPRMGVAGAALATSIALGLEALSMLALIYYRRLPGSFSLASLLRPDRELFALIWGTVSFMLVGELSWALGESAYAAIYSRISTGAMAAISMTFPVQGMSIGFFTGLSGAAAILVGYQLGAGYPHRAYLYARKILSVVLLAGLLAQLLIALNAYTYPLLYKVGPEVRQDASLLLLFFCLFYPVKILNMTLAGGVLRSGGDTRFTTLLGIFSSWVVSIPLGLLAAFVLDLPVYWVYFFVSLEEVMRLLIVWRRMRSKRWANNLVEGL